jgi:hypothetical protein
MPQLGDVATKSTIAIKDGDIFAASGGGVVAESCRNRDISTNSLSAAC